MSDARPDTQRRVRSFVRREGRFTPAQRRAFELLWPKWGLDYDAQFLNLDAVFGRQAPRTLEIGFGDGEILALQAAAAPDNDFLGIEVHRPGVGRLLNRIEAGGIGNVRVTCHDAVEVLQHQLGPAAFSCVNIFFPDPWPKKRHHKRRLIQPGFLDLLATRMQAGATLHIATDWQNYAEHIVECLEPHAGFARSDGSHERPQTRFERRGRKLGHRVWDLVYLRGR